MSSAVDEHGDTFTRLPPHDLRAEQAALGVILIVGKVDDTGDGDWARDVFDAIGGEGDFFRPAHATVYAAATRLRDRREPFDAIAVAAELTRSGDLELVGGAAYLHTLVASVPSVGQGGYYARIVAKKAMLRRMREAGTRIVQLTENAGSGDEDDVMDRCGEAFTKAAATGGGDAGVPIGDVVAQMYDQWANPQIGFTGLRTGFKKLDETLNGLRPGNLAVIAARPSIGKTTLGLDISRAAARAGEWVYFASLEMTKDELAVKFVCAELDIDTKRLQAGRLTEDELHRLTAGLGAFTQSTIVIDDRPSMTAHQIRAAARGVRRRRGLGLVVVDYLQIMGSPERKFETRELEVSGNVAAMKQLGKELAVPVVAMCQLNRKSEERADRRPQMSDARESGAIEQNADVFILIHREDDGGKDSSRKGEADFIVAKNRNGKRGVTVPVAAKLHYSKFEDMPDDVAPPEERAPGRVLDMRRTDRA